MLSTRLVLNMGLSYVLKWQRDVRVVKIGNEGCCALSTRGFLGLAQPSL
jgi:hypothetical protein